MASTTPVYGLPYQGLGDPPDGPNLGEDLALAVEAELVRIDGVGTGLDSRLDLIEGRPCCRLRHTTTQSIADNSTTQALLFNTEDEDVGNGHSTVTNTSRYTAPLTGVYQFSGGLTFASNATGKRGCWWSKGGVIVDGSAAMILNLGAAAPAIVVARTVKIALAAGDYVELMAYHNAGVALLTSGTTFEQSSMDVVYAHP